MLEIYIGLSQGGIDSHKRSEFKPGPVGISRDRVRMNKLITRMNSDNLAKAVALALVVIKLVLSLDIVLSAHWAFYLLCVLMFWGLFQGLRSVADVVTG